MNSIKTAHSHRFIHHLWHHVVVATLLTSCVYWASTFGFMGALDSATLYAAQRLVTIKTPALTAPAHQSEASEPAPVLLEITPQEYERTYSNTSPLDRKALLAELQPLLAPSSTAKLVIIDLDISPATPDDRSTGELDQLLDSAGPPVVLVVPAFRGTAALAQRQSEWMKGQCEARGRQVYFGFPYLSGEGGVILRHSTRYPSLGNVARSAVTQIFPPGAARLSGACDAPLHPEAVCEFHKQAQNIGLLRDYFKGLREHCGTSPIDFTTVASNRVASGPLGSELAGSPHTVGDKVVFVGGTYDSGDIHLTGGGRLDGVYVHADVYASHTTVLSHVAAVALEITLGIFLGFAFNAVFRGYAKANGRYQHHLQHQAPGAALLAWGASVTVLAALAFALLAATGLLIFLSASLLLQGAWLNPVPLVAGMFIDALLASRAGVAQRPEHAARFAGKAWWVARASSIMGAAWVAVTVVHILYGASHGH